MAANLLWQLNRIAIAQFLSSVPAARFDGGEGRPAFPRLQCSQDPGRYKHRLKNQGGRKLS